MLKYIIFLFAIIVSSNNRKHHSKLKIRSNHNYKTCSRDCKSAADNLLKYMDPKVNPCDDFYQFACGKILRDTNIPKDKGVVGPMYDLKGAVIERLSRVIEKPPKRTETKPFILLRKLYKTCMDKKQREKHGTASLKTILKLLGDWPVLQGSKFNEERFDWTLIMYKLRELGYPTNSLIAVDVDVNEKKSTKRLIVLGQASLGINKKNFDLGEDDKIVQEYYRTMVNTAKALGARGAFAAKDLKKSFEFEMALANISLRLEKLRNATASYNPTTLAKLQKRHPSVQWLKYINNILSIPGIKVSGDEVLIIIETPQYIEDLEKLLGRTSKRYYYSHINFIEDVKNDALKECRVLANYIIWRVIQDSIPYLSASLSNVILRLRMAQEGTLKQQQRSTECTVHVLNNMPLALGSLYVRNFFSRSFIKPVRKMVSKVLRASRHILNRTRWMDKTTKANAFKKLNSMKIYTGYAEEILDDRKLEKYYSDLQLNSDNYLLQILNVSKFNQNKNFGLLRHTVNKTEWTTGPSPSEVNAYYSPNENAFHILAAIMQAPFFSNDRPQYMNYGAIGFTIGHEVTHGFDQIGGQYDKNGNLGNWWTTSTKQAFQKKAQCIVEQYGNFTVPELGNMHLKGAATADENIADHGGLSAAHRAYNSWLKNKSNRPYLPSRNYTLKQMFWISYANSWCAKFTPSFLKNMLVTNVHSPAEFRVLGPLRNLKQFSKDFNCPLGSKMNPTHKCRFR